MTKKLVLSGTQCTGNVHIGNYLGAIKRWVDMQDDYRSYFMGADLHSITVPVDPKTHHANCLRTVAYFIACGIDTEKSVLFLQSHVPEHLELGWMLLCSAYMGELSRMTQYKDKSAKQGANIGVGLFAYPTLMAADILLYQPDYVPVGEDQKQHIELTRNLAQRINQRFDTEIFKVPAALIDDYQARIMDIQSPTNKMSKSAENQKGVVFLSDSDKDIAKKFKSAMTDSGSEVLPFKDASPAIQNLLEIYAGFSRESIAETENKWVGKQYGALKVGLADLAVSVISPIRQRADALLADETHLHKLLKIGAEKARSTARPTVDLAYKSFGFVQAQI